MIGIITLSSMIGIPPECVHLPPHSRVMSGRRARRNHLKTGQMPQHNSRTARKSTFRLPDFLVLEEPPYEDEIDNVIDWDPATGHKRAVLDQNDEDEPSPVHVKSLMFKTYDKHNGYDVPRSPAKNFKRRRGSLPENNGNLDMNNPVDEITTEAGMLSGLWRKLSGMFSSGNNEEANEANKVATPAPSPTAPSANSSHHARSADDGTERKSSKSKKELHKHQVSVNARSKGSEQIDAKPSSRKQSKSVPSAKRSKSISSSFKSDNVAPDIHRRQDLSSPNKAGNKKILDELSRAVEDAMEMGDYRTQPTESAREHVWTPEAKTQEGRRGSSSGQSKTREAIHHKGERTSRDNKDVEQIVSKILEMLKTGRGGGSSVLSEDEPAVRSLHKFDDHEKQDHYHIIHHKGDDKKEVSESKGKEEDEKSKDEKSKSTEESTSSPDDTKGKESEEESKSKESDESSKPKDADEGKSKESDGSKEEATESNKESDEKPSKSNDNADHATEKEHTKDDDDKPESEDSSSSDSEGGTEKTLQKIKDLMANVKEKDVWEIITPLNYVSNHGSVRFKLENETLYFIVAIPFNKDTDKRSARHVFHHGHGPHEISPAEWHEPPTSGNDGFGDPTYYNKKPEQY